MPVVRESADMRRVRALVATAARTGNAEGERRLRAEYLRMEAAALRARARAADDRAAALEPDGSLSPARLEEINALLDGGFRDRARSAEAVTELINELDRLHVSRTD
ncbi:hypothetical protein AB0B50_16330 [Streptomyces sp. NPDC041068]|uniref:hypothetical protein n=1 Tax=Streptomyces sp. NPDC041068 TaxID=3155130 RepID=UPI003406F436